MRRIDTNDLHDSLTHSHADTFRETAHQMGIKFFWGVGFMRWVCFEAEERRMAVPWTTQCCSTGPLERPFVDLLGQQPTSAGGAQLVILIIDDDSRLG